MPNRAPRNREYSEQRVGRWHTYTCTKCRKKFRVFLTPGVNIRWPTCPDCQWVQIDMPYIGGVLSVNHYKKGDGRHTRPEVTGWMSALESMTRLTVGKREVVQPVQIELLGIFKDRRVPDLANLHKVIGDALESALEINDKYFLFRDMGYTVDSNALPMLCIRIKVK